MAVNNSTKPLVVSNMITPQRCVKKNHSNAHDRWMASMLKNNDFHSKQKKFFWRTKKDLDQHWTNFKLFIFLFVNVHANHLHNCPRTFPSLVNLLSIHKWLYGPHNTPCGTHVPSLWQQYLMLDAHSPLKLFYIEGMFIQTLSLDEFCAFPTL